MASEVKECGCICGGDLFLTNINKVKKVIVFVYNCSNSKCNTVLFLKTREKNIII